MTLLLTEQTHAILGAAIEVSNELGCGFLEAVYQEALTLELAARHIPHVQQQHLPIAYKGRPLSREYVADFICFDRIVVEIKALAAIGSTEEAQLLNDLKATNFPVGLLLNFGTPRLQWRRFRPHPRHPCPSASIRGLLVNESADERGGTRMNPVG